MLRSRPSRSGYRGQRKARSLEGADALETVPLTAVDLHGSTTRPDGQTTSNSSPSANSGNGSNSEVSDTVWWLLPFNQSWSSPEALLSFTAASSGGRAHSGVPIHLVAYMILVNSAWYVTIYPSDVIDTRRSGGLGCECANRLVLPPNSAAKHPG